MIWFIYNLLFPVAALLMLPYYLFRMWRRGGYGPGFLQRIGVYDATLKSALSSRPRVWVHAVSVGEMYVALKFIEEWRGKDAGAAFTISTNTSTAHALAQRLKHGEDVLVYFPLDLPVVIRAVLRLVRPVMLVLVEGELWPNLIRLSKRRGIPVVVVNARMSARSFAGYRRLALFFRPVLRLPDRLFAQSAEDAARFAALGAEAERLVVTGSAKYDVALGAPGNEEKARSILAAGGLSPQALILLGGSTWPGEEAVLLDVLQRYRPLHPDLRLVLVPRHAERRDAVMAEIRARGLTVVQRSRGTETDAGSDPAVLLVDTTGELRHLYKVASVIFVGKSLTQHGGQNIVEPAACAKPVVVGPNMENFPDVIRDFLGDSAIVQVADAAELTREIGLLLSDRELRESLGRKAAAVVERKAGCLRAAVEAAMTLLPGRSASR